MPSPAAIRQSILRHTFLPKIVYFIIEEPLFNRSINIKNLIKVWECSISMYIYIGYLLNFSHSWCLAQPDIPPWP